MWSLKPYKSPPSICPGCREENPGFEEYIPTGIHILGKGACSGCGLEYYYNWPIGHGAHFPVSFDGNGIANYPPEAKQWFAIPLIDTIKKGREVACKIKRTVRKEFSEGLLLNCLDPCYGHVLWKLFNASFYRDITAPSGLIVLIPENFRWLVPDYAAEIWSVEAGLPDLNFKISSLPNFIKEACRSYGSLKLLPVDTHIDHTALDLQQFLPEAPFKLENFYRLPLCITVVWREDRFWLRSLSESWLSLVAAKYQVSWIRNWLLYRQRSKMIGVMSQIRKQIPGVLFKLTGLGTSGSFPDFVDDLRSARPDVDRERAWCQCYSKSHLIIGVHGSNMLIPTALSAGFIELLPKQKISFLSEDILMRHPPRFQTFLGRHLDIFAPTKLVARHAISILKDFKYLYHNTLAAP